MNLIGETLHEALEGRFFNKLIQFERKKYLEFEDLV
jgi:hypothetical protein